MTIVQARNAVVAGLEKNIGCPVILTDQIAEQSAFPYCYYSVLAPRISNHAFGLSEIELDDKQGYRLMRSEPVLATMSFTFCGMNRNSDDGGYIYGEDEALDLAEKGHGFFLLSGHCITTEVGDIVIQNVGNIQSRTGFLVEEAIRRYGFDVKLRYVRTDEMPNTIISKVKPAWLKNL